jgi:hypothetical protein
MVIPSAGSRGYTETPVIPGFHSSSKQYTYVQPPSLVAWKPLHTPSGTSTWVPTTRGTVTTLRNVDDSGRTSTYAPNASPDATPTSFCIASP